jgi:hypothetical protein
VKTLVCKVHNWGGFTSLLICKIEKYSA